MPGTRGAIAASSPQV
ncbi:hypothetical protein L198_00392 [Cryptococcus wingfieldii CBS 7118]|uniref:Uncharacterized protein n=1 Tax=Cryptococcus wingfieldii CBS 7118 TaxID=1295528 RepID=A0A1E3K690_9TREE|nr:hypothetical protein L198_00392 [Cryptococcus wingfieldii CBS 7118]